MVKHRTETRAERHAAKLAVAQTHNVAPVCINFMYEENVAFVVRSAACFGAKEVCVLGSLPEPNKLKSKSGSTNGLLPIKSFANPSEFLAYAREQNAFIVAAELCEGSVSIYDFEFPKDKMVYLICGHEELGVPAEILANSDAIVNIPMPGKAFCLNTSQCATALMFEYIRQYKG